jgi:methylated-DNA-[protein]-cysteine S-methyltransferase
MQNSIILPSPFGPLSVFERKGQILAIEWGDKAQGCLSDVLIEARNQLEAYFDGRLKSFSLPIKITGSTFQKSVCQLIIQIPFGETREYGDLAKKLNSSARPVGGACGRNKIPIIIPCHRVLGVKKKMTGFSGLGGIKTKKALLRHEGWFPEELDLLD